MAPTTEDAARLEASLREAGAPEAQISQEMARIRGVAQDEVLAIHPDNHRAVRLFGALTTQWRQIGLSTFSAARIVRVGLDYGVVETTARMTGLGEVVAEDFARLRVLESAAIVAMGERAA